MITLNNSKNIILLYIVLSSITLPAATSSGDITISKSLITSPSCTIFTVAMGDKVFFGNNEDWYEQDLHLWYIPSQEITTIEGTRTIYGGVYIGWPSEKRGRLYPNACGGMNEYGLCEDINGLPSVPLLHNLSGSSFYTPDGPHIHTSLWDCKNVEEVIEWYKNHKWNTSLGGQLHYADASGDAVVISVNTSTNEWAFTRKTGNFIISTNFNLDDPHNSYGYPCIRYDRVESKLNSIETEEDLTVQECADILYSVSVRSSLPISQYTIYSYIFDLVNQDVYFNYGEKYQQQKKIHIKDVLKQRKKSFEQWNTSDFLDVDGQILVKTEKIDDDFYSSPSKSSFSPVYVVIFALCVFYIYKRRKNI